MDYLWITNGRSIIYISFYVNPEANEIRTKSGGNSGIIHSPASGKLSGKPAGTSLFLILYFPMIKTFKYSAIIPTERHNSCLRTETVLFDNLNKLF